MNKECQRIRELEEKVSDLIREKEDMKRQHLYLKEMYRVYDYEELHKKYMKKCYKYNELKKKLK